MRAAFEDVAALVKGPSGVSDSSFRNNSGVTGRRECRRAFHSQTLELRPLASRTRRTRKGEPSARGCPRKQQRPNIRAVVGERAS
jgi:hypothetical protein